MRKRSTGGADDAEGAVELPIIHRFTRNIYRFVNHVYSSLPNLVSLGQDWKYSSTTVSEQSGSGDVPLVKFAERAEIMSNAIAIALKQSSVVGRESRICYNWRNLGGSCRVAITGGFGSLSKRFTVVASRDDLARLSYSQTQLF